MVWIGLRLFFCLTDSRITSTKTILFTLSTPSWKRWISGYWASTPLAAPPEVAPAYHPAALLKIFIYDYLKRVQSSRRLEREAQRDLELIWLTGRLVPDFKWIADFCKNNGTAIVAVCSPFTALWRKMKVFSRAVVATNGSKLKAVNSRDRNFTVGKIKA